MSDAKGADDDEYETGETGTRRWPLAGVALAVVWVFLTGPIADPGHVLGALLVGLLFGLPVARLAHAFFPGRTDLGRLPSTIRPALGYVAFFLRELVVANVSVARRVLDPRLPLDPAVVDVPLRVETPGAVTTIANSITLTPGTLTLDYDESTNSLRVHAVDRADVDALLATVRRWEDYALRIFDEDASPGDPARDATVDPPDTFDVGDADSGALFAVRGREGDDDE